MTTELEAAKTQNERLRLICKKKQLELTELG